MAAGHPLRTRTRNDSSRRPGPPARGLEAVDELVVAEGVVAALGGLQRSALADAEPVGAGRQREAQHARALMVLPVLHGIEARGSRDVPPRRPLEPAGEVRRRAGRERRAVELGDGVVAGTAPAGREDLQVAGRPRVQQGVGRLAGHHVAQVHLAQVEHRLGALDGQALEASHHQAHRVGGGWATAEGEADLRRGRRGEREARGGERADDHRAKGLRYHQCPHEDRAQAIIGRGASSSRRAQSAVTLSETRFFALGFTGISASSSITTSPTRS